MYILANTLSCTIHKHWSGRSERDEDSPFDMSFEAYCFFTSKDVERTFPSLRCNSYSLFAWRHFCHPIAYSFFPSIFSWASIKQHNIFERPITASDNDLCFLLKNKKIHFYIGRYISCVISLCLFLSMSVGPLRKCLFKPRSFYAFMYERLNIHSFSFLGKNWLNTKTRRWKEKKMWYLKI